MESFLDKIERRVNQHYDNDRTWKWGMLSWRPPKDAPITRYGFLRAMAVNLLILIPITGAVPLLFAILLFFASNRYFSQKGISFQAWLQSFALSFYPEYMMVMVGLSVVYLLIAVGICTFFWNRRAKRLQQPEDKFISSNATNEI